MSEELPTLASLPTPSDRNVTLRVRRSVEKHIRRGHPWIFDQAIEHQSHEGAPGDLAVVFDGNRKLMALGLYDPRSPIRVKVLHRKKPTPIDAAFFRARVDAAARKRDALGRTKTDGYRLIHGENDDLPGLVVDRYADTLVLKLYTTAWVPWLRHVVPALLDEVAPARLILRLARNVQRARHDLHGLADGQVLFGDPPDGPVLFRENDLLFEADPVAGQKTGFFLDQRDNRSRVGDLAQDARVLNVFSYSGGFSLYAARGGARQVTSLDLSQPALDAAARNFAHNEGVRAVRECEHRLLCADAFEALERLGDDGQEFDLVVIDPPSFAKAENEVPRALRSYARLTELGLRVTREGGALVLASCSSRVSAEVFRDNAERAAKAAGRHLDVFEETAHALDHPIGFAEGAYLKCLFCRV